MFLLRKTSHISMKYFTEIGSWDEDFVARYTIVHFFSGKNKNPAGSGGGSGGKKNGKDWWQEFIESNQQNILLVTGASFLTAYLLMRSSTPTKEINLQEFRRSYLEKGEVDRIVISNKSVAKVYLKSDPENVS